MAEPVPARPPGIGLTTIGLAELVGHLVDAGRHSAPLVDNAVWVRVREGAEVPLVETGTNYDAALARRTEVQRLLGPIAATHRLVSVDVDTGDPTNFRVTLRASARCGFASNLTPGGHLHWTTLPKVEATSWLELVALAEGWTSLSLSNHTHRGVDEIEAFDDLLVRAYLDALDRLFSVTGTQTSPAGGGLRRTYDERRETLRGRVKGRLDLVGYLREVASGRPDRAPCRFSAFDLDNNYNRALRFALHVCMQLPMRAALHQDDLAARARTLDSRFAGVSWSRVTRADVPSLRHPPRSFRAYERTGALPLARFIIQHLSLSDHNGGAALPGLSFTMHALFEQAFAHEAARRWGQPVDDIAQQEWRFGFEGIPVGKGFKPDVLVRPRDDDPSQQTVFVFDTKWKAAYFERPSATDQMAASEVDVIVPGEHRIRLNNADLFQIIAYAEMARRRSDNRVVAALVYPFGGQGLPPPPGRLKWRTGPQAADDVSVWVVAWDVRRGVGSRSIASLLDGLDITPRLESARRVA